MQKFVSAVCAFGLYRDIDEQARRGLQRTSDGTTMSLLPNPTTV